MPRENLHVSLAVAVVLVEIEAFGHFDYDDEKLSKYDVAKLPKKSQ